MEDIVIEEELGSGRKKTVALSLLGLGALAAGGEGYRRRRSNDSSEWARKGLIIVLVLAAIAALAAMGERKRRSRAADAASSNGSTAPGNDRVEPMVTGPVAASAE